MSQHNALELLEIYQLAFVGHKSSQNVTSFFEQEHSLRISDWRIIVLLEGVDYLSFKEIVERTGMEKSRVSRAHTRLQKAGLVQVAEGPFDKRTLVAKLSPKGSEIVQLLLPKVHEFNAALMSVLSEEERTILNVILGKLREKL